MKMFNSILHHGYFQKIIEIRSPKRDAENVIKSLGPKKID